MTFYRYPKPQTLKGWLNKVPEEFKFTLKANRQITHLKRIKNVKGEIRYFYILADSLRPKLGCILFQLPPSLTLDLDLLEEFLQTLSPRYKNVIEFRHESWYTDEVYYLLKSFNVIFCTVSSTKVPKTAEELTNWAELIKSTQAEECYVYFNNDYKAYAVQNCQMLKRLLGC